jgi:hypothetical protein
MEKKRPSGRFQPLRSMTFKICNDSIMICRNPSATAPWDSAMDRGNPTDLTALVLADRAGFLCEGKSPQWVQSLPKQAVRATSAFRPIATTERTSRHVSRVLTAEVRSYLITLSARMSSEGGTVRPSAVAVLRLRISSTFVDCWTGRSAGFFGLKNLADFRVVDLDGTIIFDELLADSN